MQIQSPARAGDVLEWIRASPQFNFRNTTMKIEANIGETLVIKIGTQEIQLTVKDNENTEMVFNNINYELHEGYIFQEDLQ